MGPMGIESREKRSQFESLQLVNSLEEEDIICVVVGLDHACSISETAVYSWGSGYSGCLGNGTLDVQMLPDMVSFSKDCRIQRIDTGEMHCCALSSTGDVFTWGHEANGRLGGGDFREMVSIPRIVNLTERIRMIACGSEHTMAASESKVYSWGDNDGARLGHGDVEDRCEPCEIIGLSGLGIIAISCGTWHSACIAAAPPMQGSGWLYTW